MITETTDPATPASRPRGRPAGSKNGKDMTAAQVRAIKTPGMHRASRNLYVRVAQGGSKAWMAQLYYKGAAHDLGLGSCDVVTLADARAKVIDLRRTIAAGLDPLTQRDADRAALAHTFKVAAEAYITSQQAGWRGKKTEKTWTAGLTAYVYPVIGDLPVADVTTDHMLRILSPIWGSKNVTAERVRGYVERVLDAAKVQGFRSGDNPARWGGHLDKLLAARCKVHKTVSHASLDYTEIAALMAEMRAVDSLPVRCLRFAILTGGRSEEARCARWSEIDLADKVWHVPAKRMKNGENHDVPLSEAALGLLGSLPRFEGNDFVFAKPTGHGLGKNAMLQALADFKRTVVEDGVARPITVHGFRASFLGWGDLAGFPAIVTDTSIAHKQSDKVRAAYERAKNRSVFDERRRCMAEWAAYCGG